MSAPNDRDMAMSPHSPQSLADAGMDSTKGSPDTHPTAFSPEVGIKQGSLGYDHGHGSAYKTNRSPTHFGFAQGAASSGAGITSHAVEDPFVVENAVSGPGVGTGLAGTASGMFAASDRETGSFNNVSATPLRNLPGNDGKRDNNFAVSYNTPLRNGDHQTTPRPYRGNLGHRVDIQPSGINSHPGFYNNLNASMHHPELGGGNYNTMPKLSAVAPNFSPTTPHPRAGRLTPSSVNAYTPGTPYSDYGHFISPLEKKSNGHGARVAPISRATKFGSTGKVTAASPLGTGINGDGNDGPMTVVTDIDVPADTSLSQGTSRCICIDSHDGRQLDSQIIVQRLQLVAANMVANGLNIHEHNGKVYARFDDIKKALEIHPKILKFEHGLRADFISPKEYSQMTNSIVNLSTAYEGQVSIVVHASGKVNDGWKKAEATIKGLLAGHGDLFAFKRISSAMDGIFRAIVEFCSVSSSLTAVSTFDGVNYEGIRLGLSLHRPDLAIVSPEVSRHASDISALEGSPQETTTPAVSNVEDITAAVQNMALVRSDNTDYSQGFMNMQSPSMPLGIPNPVFYQPVSPSPFGGAGTPMIDRGQGQMTAPQGYQLVQSPFAGSLVAFPGDYHHRRGPVRGGLLDGSRSYQGRSEPRRSGPMRGGRGPRDLDRNNNHVDVNRIREGTDVRTTIMLRNIPNKVDQPMLKAIIDESSWGKYDFMYLRIDFQNDCNVGYAFINFVDPLDIIDFANARGNQRWYDFVLVSNDPLLTRNRNCFKSDKVAEISYATIQGKDCLVQKFRNSSVMLEQPHYRPKLYFTGNGPHPELAGQEEPFPSPDNQSKMRRSVENAEHVGLFTPNAGQHMRDEQRRRRSQFDRGTRMAALEEYDYQNDRETNYYQLE